MSEPTEIDLSYLAGFFDGEGCIDTTRRSLRVTLTNIQTKVLEISQRFWGGSIQSIGKATKARAWQLHGKDAVAFLKDIVPYLHIKHAQAILAIELNSRGNLRHLQTLDTPTNILEEEKSYRDWLKYKMRYLRGRGTKTREIPSRQHHGA